MKLAIISHTEHYKRSDGTIVGWGPTVSELNHLAQDFEEIYHIAFLHKGQPPPSALPYVASNIIFVPLQPVGGKSVRAKLGIIAALPNILFTVRQTLKKVDAFQLRTPTGMGVFLIPYLSLFTIKKGWYKYAGNWNQKSPPLGYGLQRWMLKRQKRKVTINGRWPGQPAHCLSFENPCLTESERAEGAELVGHKEFVSPFNFCFVGRLEDAKGVQRIINAFGRIDNLEQVKAIHFVGDGEKMEYYKEQCQALNLPAVFHGFLERRAVFKIYQEAHFMVLPSASEGFPKVVAEAMNYGCIPIVSQVSSIEQYVNKANGWLLKPGSTTHLREVLQRIFSKNAAEYAQMAADCYLVAAKFTFKQYRQQIQKLLYEV